MWAARPWERVQGHVTLKAHSGLKSSGPKIWTQRAGSYGVGPGVSVQAQQA